MNKLKLFGLAAIAALGLSSCVSQTYMVTDNPIGTKIGVARYKMFAKDADFSLEEAAKNGKITKIGLVEVKTTFFILPFIKTTVYGE
jgi:hypothetical protein